MKIYNIIDFLINKLIKKVIGEIKIKNINFDNKLYGKLGLSIIKY